jgi:hypothetical protein
LAAAEAELGRGRVDAGTAVGQDADAAADDQRGVTGIVDDRQLIVGVEAAVEVVVERGIGEPRAVSEVQGS